MASNSLQPYGPDHSPPGASVHGILQARILEWVAMPSSRGSSRPRNQTLSLMSPALAGEYFTTSATWKPPDVLEPTCNYDPSGLLSCFPSCFLPMADRWDQPGNPVNCLHFSLGPDSPRCSLGGSAPTPSAFSCPPPAPLRPGTSVCLG